MATCLLPHASLHGGLRLGIVLGSPSSFRKEPCLSSNTLARGAPRMIDLPEGLYEVDQAYLVDASKNYLLLRDVSFEIWLDKQGRKQLRGRGLVRNFAFAEMLEDTERVDLVLCFFEDYYLWLKEPIIQVGKVFEPETESSMIFSIGESISLISEEQFSNLTGVNG